MADDYIDDEAGESMDDEPVQPSGPVTTTGATGTITTSSNTDEEVAVKKESLFSKAKRIGSRVVDVGAKAGHAIRQAASSPRVARAGSRIQQGFMAQGGGKKKNVGPNLEMFNVGMSGKGLSNNPLLGGGFTGKGLRNNPLISGGVGWGSSKAVDLLGGGWGVKSVKRVKVKGKKGRKGKVKVKRRIVYRNSIWGGL
jgi:hypothetical protein